jgi:hypothetical protein
MLIMSDFFIVKCFNIPYKIKTIMSENESENL